MSGWRPWSNAIVELSLLTTRRKGMSSRWQAAVLAVAMFAGGCSSDEAVGGEEPTDDPDAAAVWFLAPNERPSPEARKLRLEVTQIACNDGETNPVRSVSTTYTTQTVTITMSTEPVSSGAHHCQVGLARSHELELDEPVGERRLVDGRCSDRSARTTAWCDPDGIRYDPAAPMATGLFQVRGRVLLVGGPAGTEPKPAPGGEVRFTGPVTLTVNVTDSGDFLVELPSGTYEVAGRTPSFHEGEWQCSAPRLIVTEPQHIDVVCPMR